MSGLEGRVVIVTGAARGIGLAAAEHAARNGAAVVLADLDSRAGEEAVAKICAAGAEAVFRAADVSEREQAADLVAYAVAEYGRLDAAFNNAGISEPLTSLEDLEPQTWERVIAVNLSGTLWCLQAEVRQLVEQGGGGSVVNMASGAAIVPAPLQPSYTAAKHGVLGLTKLAAQENAKRGIRVNAVLPGTIDTPGLRSFMEANPGVEAMIRKGTATGELGTPHQVAEVVVWLMSDASSYVNGQGIVVDGGAIVR